MKKNIANRIMASNPNYTHRLVLADSLAERKDQDWDNEATTFIFPDGSSLKFNGKTQSIVDQKKEVQP